jgi:WD40 repeat protein
MARFMRLGELTWWMLEDSSWVRSDVVSTEGDCETVTTFLETDEDTYSVDISWATYTMAFIAGNQATVVNMVTAATMTKDNVNGYRLDLSPDGSIVALPAQNDILLYEAETGVLIGSLNHPEPVSDIKFSSDGELLTSISGRYRLHVWNVRELEEVTEIAGHPGASDIFWADENRKLVTQSDYENNIRVWDWRSGREVSIKDLLELDFAGAYRELIFDNTNQRVIGLFDRTMQSWDLQADTNRYLTASNMYVAGLSLNQEQSLITTAGYDGIIHFWNPQTLRQVDTINIELGIGALAVSPDTNLVAVGICPNSRDVFSCSNIAIRLIDRHNGDIVDELSLGTPYVSGLALSASGRYMAASGHAGFGNGVIMKLWNLETGSSSTLTGHSLAIRDFAFSSDENMLVSSGFDQSFRLWNVESGTLLHEILNEYQTETRSGTAIVEAVAFSPDGMLLATGDGANNIRLWDVETLTVLATLEGEVSSLTALNFSADGTLIISGSNQGIVRVWGIPESDNFSFTASADRIPEATVNTTTERESLIVAETGVSSNAE